MLLDYNERKLIFKKELNLNIQKVIEIYKGSNGINKNKNKNEQIKEKEKFLDNSNYKINEYKGNKIDILFKYKEDNDSKSINISFEKNKKFSNVIKIKYKINNSNTVVSLFHKAFISNNKKKCQIIYSNKEYVLKDTLKIKNCKKTVLILKLNNISNVTNMCAIFKDCSSLLCLPDIDK